MHNDKANRYNHQFFRAEILNGDSEIKKAIRETGYHTNQPSNVRLVPKESTIVTNHSVECFVCKEHPYTIKQYQGVLVTLQCCTKHSWQDCLKTLNKMFNA